MQTATNPTTGERYVYEGGEWQPIKTATNPETGERFEYIGNKWQPMAQPGDSSGGKLEEYGQTALAVGGAALGGLGQITAPLAALGGASYEEAQGAADSIAEATQYSPTNKAAQENLQAIGDFLDNDTLQWFMSLGDRAGDATNEAVGSNEYTDFAAPFLGHIAKLAPDIVGGFGAGLALKQGAKGVKQMGELVADDIKAPIAKRAAEKAEIERQQKIEDGLLSDNSAGSSGVAPAQQRIETADSLPVPVPLTRAQATRNPARWTDEQEMRKLDPEGELNQFSIEQQKALQANLGGILDDIGENAANVDGVPGLGRELKAALDQSRRQAEDAKNALYAEAKQAGEWEAPISTDPVMQAWEKAFDEAYHVADAGKMRTLANLASERGIDLPMQRGMQGPSRPAKIGDLEDFRQDVNRHTDFMNDKPLRTLLTGGVDKALNASPSAPKYQAARASYRDIKRQFDETDINRDIGQKKRRSETERTADADVLKRVNRAPLREIEAFKAKIVEAPDGAKVWQAYTQKVLEDIVDDASKGIDRVGLNHNKLRKSIKELDDAGKLDALFGKQQAQTLRDVSETAMNVGNEPFGAFPSRSNNTSIFNALGKYAQPGSKVHGIARGIGNMAAENMIKSMKQTKLTKAQREAMNARGLLNE
jgi:hypothetical protein